MCAPISDVMGEMDYCQVLTFAQFANLKYQEGRCRIRLITKKAVSFFWRRLGIPCRKNYQ